MSSKRNSSRRLSDEAKFLRSLGLSLLEIAKTLYPEEAARLERLHGKKRKKEKEKLKVRVKKLLEYEPVGESGDPFLDFDVSGGERNPLSHRHVFAPSQNLFIEKKRGLRGKERVFYEYEQFLRRFWELFLKKYDMIELLWQTMLFIHQKSFDKVYDEFKVNYWGGKKVPQFLKAYAYVVAYFSLVIHHRYDLINSFKLEVHNFYNIDKNMVQKVYASVFEVVSKIFIL